MGCHRVVASMTHKHVHLPAAVHVCGRMAGQDRGPLDGTLIHMARMRSPARMGWHKTAHILSLRLDANI
jgi:hypothetical protein